MKLEEAQILAGEVASFGGPGPMQRWIIVAPFGKAYALSIDDPSEPHIMPLCVARDALVEGRLKIVGRDEHHPALRLQRAKEQMNVRDTHMGLYGDNLAKMLQLLRDAVATGKDYAAYAAGEIQAMLQGARYRFRDLDAVQEELQAILGGHPDRHGGAVSTRAPFAGVYSPT